MGYTRRLIDAALNRKPQGGSKTLIIETHKVVVAHRRKGFQGWCGACVAEVEMVKPEEAAAYLRISLRRVFRRVEGDTLHFTETADGLLFICRNSLMKTREEVIEQ